MNAGRAFALLFVLAFFGISALPKEGPIYYAAGTIILVGFASMIYGATRPIRR